MLNRVSDDPPDEGRRELETEYRAYRARVRVASQATVFGLAAVFALLAVLPVVSAADQTALRITAGLVLATGLGWFLLVPHGLFGAWRIFVAAAIAQAVLVVLLSLTGGAASMFFPFFLLPPLVLILSGEMRQVGLLSAGAALALIAVALIQLSPGAPDSSGRVAIRIIELATFAGFGALGARAFGDTRRTLATRAAVLATAYQTATHSTHLDPGTGLPNRRYFDDRIGELITAAKRRGLPFALVTFIVRGTDPQAAFDPETQARPVAAALRDVLLPDETLFRMGSDGFLVLLFEGDPARAHDLAVAADRAVAALPGIGLAFSVVPVSLDDSARGIRKRVAAALSGSADLVDIMDIADAAGS